MKIKQILTGKILYESKKETIKETVEEAARHEADLSGANLLGADLSGANLRGADLWGAYLWGANLQGANLNCIFYRTKVTEKQKEEIFNSDLFEAVD